MEIIKTRTIRGLLSITLCFCAFVIGRGSEPELPIQAQEGGRVFELRMYTVEDGKVHLYDLSKDIGERNDVAAKHPEVVERIRKLMADQHVPSPHFPMNPID